MNAPQTAPQEPGATERHGGEPRSVGDIVSDITTDLSTLVRSELDLAKVELKSEMKVAGKGAGMLGGAALAGYFALLFISLALTFLLDNVMPLELAGLVTALLWGSAAGALALVGKNRIKEANPQLPKTQQTLKEDVQWARAQKN